MAVFDNIRRHYKRLKEPPPPPKPERKRTAKPPPKVDYPLHEGKHHVIKCTEDEWEAWQVLAAKEKLPMRQWLRKVVKAAAEAAGVVVEVPRKHQAPLPIIPPRPARRGRIKVDEVARWLAVNVRRERKKRLLFNVDLAKRTGLAPETISRIQSATYLKDNPSQQYGTLRWLVSLANAINITPAELLAQPQDMSPLEAEPDWGDTVAARKRREEQRQAMPPEKRAMSELEESLGFRFDD